MRDDTMLDAERKASPFCAGGAIVVAKCDVSHAKGCAQKTPRGHHRAAKLRWPSVRIPSAPPCSPGKPARFPGRQKPSQFRSVSGAQRGLRTEFRPFSRVVRLQSPGSLCPQNSVSRTHEIGRPKPRPSAFLMMTWRISGARNGAGWIGRVRLQPEPARPMAAEKGNFPVTMTAATDRHDGVIERRR